MRTSSTGPDTEHAHSGETPLLLGIDTGGTYTDAVLYSTTAGVRAKAKALTTRHDLAIGIGNAVDAVLADHGSVVGSIGLVSMSTTLATNALVEGEGARVGLVMVGFSETDLARDGLRQALGRDPVLFIDGGHDGHGNERPLDLAPLRPWLETTAPHVAAFAVCSYFAVLNPAHENAVSDLIRMRTGLPVTASHELSAKLGGPRRALTTLLNARLIPLIDRLIGSAMEFLTKRSIEVPVMMVRGDGALVSAEFARMRPIETILSGPAASLVGAQHLTGLSEAIVSDIGGTTTDVALLFGGRPRLDPDGAVVGSYRTMVEAVATRTFGLGGDSEVGLEDEGLETRIRLGPRRLIPLSLAETLHPGSIVLHLERQLNQLRPDRLDGQFAVSTGLAAKFAAGLSDAEVGLYRRIGDKPKPLDQLLAANFEKAILPRLISRGLVQLIGFTPSDAAHAAGRQETWNSDAARLGAELSARRRDRAGRLVAAGGEAFSIRVLTKMTQLSADAILETVFAEDGLLDALSPSHPVVRRAMKSAEGIARFSLALDRPVVGAGASARLHYASLGRYLGAECLLPEHLEVANAVGAVAGQVRITVEAKIAQPHTGRFRVTVGDETCDLSDEEEALRFGEERARALAGERASQAGAEMAEVSAERIIEAVETDGQRVFIAATILAAAVGRPRIARSNN